MVFVYYLCLDLKILMINFNGVLIYIFEKKWVFECSVMIDKKLFFEILNLLDVI